MKNKAEKIFDGLHGDIVLICQVCNKRHRPRCKIPEAVMLGKLGGSKKSAKKAEASRLNGKKGGRPKQNDQRNFIIFKIRS